MDQLRRRLEDEEPMPRIVGGRSDIVLEEYVESPAGDLSGENPAYGQRMPATKNKRASQCAVSMPGTARAAAEIGCGEVSRLTTLKRLAVPTQHDKRTHYTLWLVETCTVKNGGVARAGSTGRKPRRGAGSWRGVVTGTPYIQQGGRRPAAASPSENSKDNINIT
ncbi:hypothetical protein K438DRAFT_1782856 [Mycena galopus ATCC 62051]|nr:hypothetical protein K438DRAFT_1782856 [Mycena galopus ATCC 62051]